MAGIALIMRGPGGGAAGGSPDHHDQKSLAILQERYSAGEIDQESYQRMKPRLAA
ncbi:MAG: SHOCT domain-containing protein [Chloroflexi bacterium]|nr:SHOCT domain-containing protein [Chloroflexota bacterium]